MLKVAVHGKRLLACVCVQQTRRLKPRCESMELCVLQEKMQDGICDNIDCLCSGSFHDLSLLFSTCTVKYDFIRRNLALASRGNE